MKHRQFKLVAVSISDTDTPWTHVGHVWCVLYFYYFLLSDTNRRTRVSWVGHAYPFKGHRREPMGTIFNLKKIYSGSK